MKEFSLEQAVQAVHGTFCGDSALLSRNVRGVVIDNRRVEPDFLFVPIKGERFDGHDFIPAAYEAGAVACITERPLETDHPYILVEDSLAAFQGLAEFYKSLFSVKTVGITGSVGKTTTNVKLGACLARLGKRVLTVDIDPQGNASSGLGVNKRDIQLSTYDILIADAKAEDVLQRTSFENIDLLPASMDLAAAEIELVEAENRVMKLKQALAPIKEQYDYILIDCPPSLGLITLNALNCCDTLLIPIQCEYYALEGLSQLMGTVRQVKRLYNPQIEIEGVLLTMFDGRLNLTLQVVEEVKKFFPKKVYRTVIPRNVRLSEAPSFGQPVLYYDRTSRGSKAYEDLADEFLENNQ